MPIKIQITTNVQETDTQWASAMRNAARATDGRLWVSYHGPGAPGDVLASFSLDGGLSWQEEIAAAADSDESMQALVIDSNNVPHILYEDNANNIRHVHRTGGSWAAPETVDSRAGGSTYQLRGLCIDDSDVIHLTLSDLGAASVFNYIQGTTGSWGARETIEFLFSVGGDIAVGSDGVVVAVYERALVITIRRRVSGIWQLAETVSTKELGGLNIPRPSLAIDSANAVHIVWPSPAVAPNDVQIYYRKRTAGGFANPDVLVASPQAGEDFLTPLLVLSFEVAAYVIYQEAPGSSDQSVRYKVITNEVVGSEVTLDVGLEWPGGHSTLYTGLWELFNAASVIVNEFQPIAVLLAETAFGSGSYILWFFANDAIPTDNSATGGGGGIGGIPGAGFGGDFGGRLGGGLPGGGLAPNDAAKGGGYATATPPNVVICEIGDFQHGTREFLEYLSPDGLLYEFHVDGHAGRWHDGRYVLSQTGWGTPPIDYVTQRGPFQDGATVKDFHLQPRIIQLSIRNNYLSRLGWWSGRGNLLDALRPNRQSTPNGTFPGRLTRVGPNGDRRSLDVFISEGPRFEPRTPARWDEWSFQEVLRFTAFDPVIYDPGRVDESFVMTLDDELVFPITFNAVDEIRFGDGLISLTLAITYTGTWKSFPLIVITGRIENPAITNLGTGETISLQTVIDGGRTVIIDLTPGQKTVVDDLGTNLIGTVTSVSDLATFHLAAAPEVLDGVNQIRLTGLNPTGAASVQLRYFTRFYGI